MNGTGDQFFPGSALSLYQHAGVVSGDVLYHVEYIQHLAGTADDIMEPYRPLIDAKVLEIISKYEEQELTTTIKAELLQVLTQTVYYKDNVSPLMVAIAKTTTSLQKCFAGKQKTINYPKLWN